MKRSPLTDIPTNSSNNAPNPFSKSGDNRPSPFKSKKNNLFSPKPGIPMAPTGGK